jgi:hypothetical protein
MQVNHVSIDKFVFNKVIWCSGMYSYTFIGRPDEI